MPSKARNSGSGETVNPKAEAQEQDPQFDSTREERIRRRAYELYMERGAEPGHEVEDWLHAERELPTGPSEAAAE